MITVCDAGFPFVHANLYFRVGPVFDPTGLHGLTTLTNRMLMRGTLRRSRADLEEAIESLGTELYTSTQNHAVGLGGTVLTRNLGPFLDLVGEMLAEPAFDEAEVAKVRREMAAELEAARDEDSTLARLWFRRLVFEGHPLGHGASGSPTSLEAIGAADVRAHFARHYTRSNLCVGASGDLEAGRFGERIEPTLAALPTGPGNDWGALPEVGPAKGVRVALIDKPERTQAQIMLGHPAPDAADPDFLALSVGTAAFGGTFTARLMQEVRVKRGLSYGAYAHLASARVGGWYALSAAPSAEDTLDTLRLLLSEYARFVDEGLTDEEVEFARGYAINAFPFSVETPALQVAQRVRGALLGRPPDFLDTYLDRLAALTPDAVRDAVRRRLQPRDLVAVVVCTADDIRDPAADLGPVTIYPFDQGE